MTWWRRLLHRKQMEEQLERELRFHLEAHEADLIARGHDRATARRQARQALGGADQVKEGCRDARGTRWLEDLAQDTRYALRTLRQKPGFAIVTVAILALGIGVTTVMYTTVDGVLLRPLPYREPNRLVALTERTDWSNQFGNLWSFTYPNYLDCKRSSQTLEMAAWRYNGGTLVNAQEPEYVQGLEISANLFPMLGIAVSRGRGFLPADDGPGAPPVALISVSLWRRRFGGSSSAVGKRVIFGGKPYSIIGIAPDAFRMNNGERPDLLIPLGQDTAPAMENREIHGIGVWARLRPDATLATARTELAVIGRRLAAQYPKSNRGRTFIAERLRPNPGDTAPRLWLLLGAAGLVLLIASTNIASLLLARTGARERELAMRVALGAGRGRLARQCLTECAILGLCGGALGLLLARFGIRPLLAFWPFGLPRAEEVRLDGRIFLFALAVSLATAFLFGLAPALRVPVRELDQTLRAGARATTARLRRSQSAFVISEIALAVVLLVSAGIIGRTVLRDASLDPGLNLRNVLIARVGLSPGSLESPDKIRTAWQQILDSARRVPGVQALAMVDTVPMRYGNNQIGYWTTSAKPPVNQQPLVLADSVTPDYLKVTGIPLLEGRFFNDGDRQGHELVAVIDEVLARQAFGNANPIGKEIWFDLNSGPALVVGVVGHVRYWGLAGDDQASVRAQLYYPFAQVPDKFLPRWSELMSVAVRTAVPPLGLVDALRRDLRGTDGDQVLYEISTLDQLAGDSLAPQRFLLVLFGIFAGLSLLLACLGIYGVLAYMTSRRVPEIGVRMALGATAGTVIRMVLRQSLVMIAAGGGLGTIAALAAARLLERFVVGVRGAEPLSFALMIAVLAAAALGASFLPARRASRIDPVRALRQE